MMNYTHLSLVERHYIEKQRKQGVSMQTIATELNRAQSTISRELRRNTGQRGYRHQQANQKSLDRHKSKPKAIKLNDSLKQLIHHGLEQGWSPEQIAGRFKKEGVVSLHHETIYQYILRDKQAGGQLYKLLRHQSKPYRKRYGSGRNKTGIPNRVDIDERPEVVNQRARVGDWEADTIIGKNHKGALATLDERTSKLRLAMATGGKKAKEVSEAICTVLGPLKDFVKTITFDNGKEFAFHEQIAEHLDCETYFAKPYHSWERGQNENANGLLRQYFPKSMELLDVIQNEVFKAVHQLNSRPRKCLDYKTPYEAFKEMTGIDVKNLLGYALIT